MGGGGHEYSLPDLNNYIQLVCNLFFETGFPNSSNGGGGHEYF